MSDSVTVTHILAVTVEAEGKNAVVANTEIRHVSFVYKAVSVGFTANLITWVNI